MPLNGDNMVWYCSKCNSYHQDMCGCPNSGVLDPFIDLISGVAKGYSDGKKEAEQESEKWWHDYDERNRRFDERMQEAAQKKEREHHDDGYAEYAPRQTESWESAHEREKLVQNKLFAERQGGEKDKEIERLKAELRQEKNKNTEFNKEQKIHSRIIREETRQDSQLTVCPFCKSSLVKAIMGERGKQFFICQSCTKNFWDYH